MWKVRLPAGFACRWPSRDGSGSGFFCNGFLGRTPPNDEGGEADELLQQTVLQPVDESGQACSGTLSSEAKHTLHVIVLLAWIGGFAFFCGVFADSDPTALEPVQRYGWLLTCLLYGLRVLSLLVLPQCIFNLLGLVFFNAFKEKVHLKAAPLLAPLVCFRVVTRGDYPLLVKENLEKNMLTCYAAGMENFIFEIVTDNALALPKAQRVREVIVPSSYRTKSGARFKARALQYCLEEDVNILQDDDWIVHLDEETLLTVNSVCGILNFVEDGKHEFGQGVITYANGEIVNWLTTLSDSFRVADDMGKLRAQLGLAHSALFGWKGSYVVSQAGAERRVSFDHGPEGSIAEDCYFSMIAMQLGYSFNFIEGEMHEKSPFTTWDFLQQRKRWLQGIFLTVHSRRIRLVNKLLLALSFYAWATMPLTSLQIFITPFFPLPKWLPFDFAVTFVGAVNLYMYMFGVTKSFSNKYRHSWSMMIAYTVGAMLTIPFNIVIENLAVVLGMMGRKDQFYIVNKDVMSV